MIQVWETFLWVIASDQMKPSQVNSWWIKRISNWYRKLSGENESFNKLVLRLPGPVVSFAIQNPAKPWRCFRGPARSFDDCLEKPDGISRRFWILFLAVSNCLQYRNESEASKKTPDSFYWKSRFLTCSSARSPPRQHSLTTHGTGWATAGRSSGSWRPARRISNCPDSQRNGRF